MIKQTYWEKALLFLTAPVLVVGCFAWVFPREATSIAGSWALPTLSLIGLVLAIGLAAQGLLLRGLLVVLAITMVLGWNHSSPTSTSHFAGACIGCLLMVAIGRSASTPRRLTLAMMTFLCGGMVVLLVGLAGASVRSGTLLESLLPIKLLPMKLGLAGLASDGDVNPNALAAAALLVVPLAVSVLVLRTRGKAGWGLLSTGFAVVVTGAVTLTVSHSRSAWIDIWLVLVGLLVLGMRSWLARVFIGAVVVAPLFLATGSLLFLSKEAVMRDAGNYWTSAKGRAQITNQAFERWKQSPWLGLGLNEFRNVYKPRDGDIPQNADIVHAHNIVLQTALDIGVLGSAAYWGVLIFLLVRARQAATGLSALASSAAVGSACSIITGTLFGLSDAVPLGSKIGTLQWMAGGLILAAWQVQLKLTDSRDAVSGGRHEHHPEQAGIPIQLVSNRPC
jgi:putative inorganic carbon (HCO3(-)) transporter